MKECRYIREQLVSYLDGELSTSEQEAVEQHLGRCSACQREAKLLGKVGRSLTLLPTVEPGHDYLEGFHWRLARQRRRTYIRRAAVLVPLAAVLLFALLVPAHKTAPPEVVEVVQNLEFLDNLEGWENLPVLEMWEELEALPLLSELDQGEGS